jgi:hypothetical protein
MAGLPEITPSTDFYGRFHKFLRRELYAAALAAGTLNHEDRPAVMALAGRIGGLVGLLRQHADHEDTFVHPLLAKWLPTAQLRLAREHLSAEAGLSEIDRCRGALVDSPSDATVRTLYRRLLAFIGTYEGHLQAEEDLTPTLLAVCPKEELQQAQRRIVESLPPDFRERSLQNLLPVLTPQERLTVVEETRSTTPPQALDGMLRLARETLGVADWEWLAVRLERADAA